MMHAKRSRTKNTMLQITSGENAGVWVFDGDNVGDGVGEGDGDGVGEGDGDGVGEGVSPHAAAQERFGEGERGRECGGGPKVSGVRASDCALPACVRFRSERTSLLL